MYTEVHYICERERENENKYIKYYRKVYSMHCFGFLKYRCEQIRHVSYPCELYCNSVEEKDLNEGDKMTSQ